MRRFVLVALAIVALASYASAVTVDFNSTLAGANERPDPADSTATGMMTGQLTGDPGLFIFTYHIEYSGLTGPATAGHIHDAILPEPTPPFTEKFGAPVHDLPSLDSPIDGVWSYTDASQPLTDELAAALQAGRLYVNIHSEQFPDGEIRGQLLAEAAPPPPPPPGAIPLPPAVWTGMMTMAAAGFSVWRTQRRMA
jgi:hypothetical protein